MKLRVFTNLEESFLGLECGSSLPEVFLMEMWRYVAVKYTVSFPSPGRTNKENESPSQD